MIRNLFLIPSFSQFLILSFIFGVQNYTFLADYYYFCTQINDFTYQRMEKNIIAKLIASALNLQERAVANTLSLLEEGCTIPFISR